MADGKLHLRIVTPTEVKADEYADMVIMRSVTGDIGILPGRAALSALLDFGILRILKNGSERKIAVFGGFAEVEDDTLTIVTDLAEWPEDVDSALAQIDRTNAEQRLREKSDGIDVLSDQVLLRRSLVRIELSDYPLVGESKFQGP